MPRLTVRSIRRAEVAAVRRLVPLYVYDLLGDHWDVDRDGSFFSRAWHRRFWARRGQHHFVIRADGKLAGFVLVRDRAHFAGHGVREISEFFVLRKYRRRGVGTHAAYRIFATFPGRWEVAELTFNVAAQRFWRRVIRACASGRVEETERRHDDLSFVVQTFSTTPRRRTR